MPNLMAILGLILFGAALAFGIIVGTRVARRVIPGA